MFVILMQWTLERCDIICGTPCTMLRSDWLHYIFASTNKATINDKICLVLSIYLFTLMNGKLAQQIMIYGKNCHV